MVYHTAYGAIVVPVTGALCPSGRVELLDGRTLPLWEAAAAMTRRGSRAEDAKGATLTWCDCVLLRHWFASQKGG